MNAPMDTDTAAQENDRLRREIAHVNEQAVVAHHMAMDWRQRAMDAEEQYRRLERKYHNLKKRKGVEREADEPDESQDDDEALSLPQVW